jgi:AsmA family/Uncharacterized protein conserved in bacteria (DUF2125)
MTRRRLGWLVVVAVAVVGIAATGAWLDRESTLVSAARVAVERSQGAIELEGVHGSLLGRIHADRVVWRANGREVALDDATLAWSPLWLLLATVSFHDVHVAKANVTIAETPGEPVPPTLPETLRLPLRVRVHDTVVDQLTFVRGGEAREASQLAFEGDAGWQSWTLKVAARDTPFGKVDGRLEIGASPPYPVDGHLDVTRGGDAPLALDVVASGTLARAVEMNATLRAQSSAADATLVYAPLQAQPVERAAATLRALDLRHLLPTAPEAVFDGTLTAASENGELRGDMKVSNRVPGTIDAGRVPLSSFAAQIGALPDAFTLEQIEAELGPAGKLTGNGRVGANDVAFQLAGEQLNVHHLHAAMKPTRLAASIETRGTLASQDIRAKLTQQAYRASFDGSVADGTMKVRQARLDIGDGSAEAKGSIALDSGHAFDIKATLSRFDPSRVIDPARLGKLQPARLNARVDASGSVQPVVQVRAAIDVAPSTAFGLPTTAKVQWRSRGIDDPQIAIDGKATIGETRIGVNGRLVNPQDLRSLDLTLDLSGHDLAQLYTISGLPFPSTPEYELAGHLQYDDRTWTLKRFSGKVGRSDLAGDFIADLRAAKPFMRADLKSQNLDMRDLAGFVGANDTASTNPPGRVLPHGEYRLDKLNAANADIRFTGERIRNETLPLNRMATHLVLRDGVLVLDPLKFGMDAGDIDGWVTLDATKPTIAVVADISGDQLRLERFAPAVKKVLQTGPVNGRVRLTMHGNSIAAMLGTANGDVALAMTGGSVSDLALRLADLDVANSLLVMARDKNRSVPINCFVADFTAQDGVLKPKTLTLDAQHTTATVEGQIDLRAEKLDLRVVAKPKDFSLLALRGPIIVSGTFADPAVHADLANAILRTGAAIALGVIAPPAAPLPFVQVGSPEAFNCSTKVDAIARFVRAETSSTQEPG